MKILIVDDDADVADSLAMVLEIYGFQTSVHYTAADGLSEAHRIKPDVVLHDISMPGMNGFDAVEQLRAHAPFQCTLILAITGHDGKADRDRAGEAGFDALLVKPIDVEVLLRILKEREKRSVARNSIL